MSIVVLAKDCENTPSKPVESCGLFYNCKSAALANQELHQQFEDMGLGDVGFAHGTTQALHNQMFLYLEGSTPSNFTAFTVSQGKSLDYIKKSAKQTIRVPTDFVGLQNQLQYWKGACRILFGKDSVPLGRLEELETLLSKYKNQFNAKALLNEMLTAKKLYTVDARMQR
eukprot:15324448-Ditylum_brightwellii.AAC.1